MKTKDFVICALFAAIICVSTVITIPLPFTPVPITLQVMTICIAGAVLGYKKGVIAVGIYILLGFIGLPVFSGMKSGPAVLFGPTGGYILGFLPMTFFIGFLVCNFIKSKDSAVMKSIKYFIVMFLGLIVLYLFGTIQLMFIAHLNLAGALATAVIPFVGFDIAKIIFAVVISYFIRQNIYNIALQ